MSILSRLHKGINAIGGTINGVIGIPLDLARGAVSDSDEYDGLISTLYHTVINRGGQVLENTIGPEGIAATAISPIPASYRHSVYEKNVAPVLNAFETVGREAIREPIATLINVGSVGAAEHDQLAFLNPDSWKRAYRIAQNRSLGQSLALGVGRVNINDEAEIASFMNTDAYEIMSGVADGLTRLFLEPDVIAGSIYKGVRASRLGLTTPEQIARAATHPKVIEFSNAVWDLKNAGDAESAAARIRSRFYPDHPRGPEISNALAAAETPEALHWTLRALMKDPEAYARLSAIQSATQPLIERATARLEDLTIMKEVAKYPHPEWEADIAKAQAEVDRLYTKTNKAGSLLAASGAIQELPRVTKAGQLRESIVRSNYYSQRGTFSKPLHAVFDMNPQRLINASDMTGDVHLDRMLGVADMDRPTRDLYRSRYMEATDVNSREAILLEAQQDAVTTLATNAGMTTNEIAVVLENLAAQRGHTLDAIAKRVFDKHGNSKFDILDENGEVIRHHLPASMTQDAVLVPLVDINEVKKATTRIGQFKSRHPTTSIPPTLIESLYRVWKPSMLLRVGWPIKIVMDEQLRIMAKIGSLAQIRNLKSGLINYSTDYIAKARELGEGNIAKGLREVRGYKSKSLRSEFGLRELEYRGYNVEGVYGIKGDMKKHIAEQASANDTFRKMGGGTEETLLNSLREYGAHVKSIDPDHADYAATYNWAADKLKQDPIAKLLLATDDVETVIHSLRSTVEGTEILRKSSVKAHNVRNWVNEINDQIDHYTAGMPELREKLASGKLTHDDLAAAISDPAMRPAAHAEVLAQATGDSYLHKQFVQMVDGAYRRLGSTPTDVLSRNRYIDHVYQAEVKRQIDLLDQQILTGQPVFDELQEIVQPATSGTPEIRIPGTPIKPLAPGYPPMFHGTSRRIEGQPGDRYSYGSGAANLMGPGFYTTEAQDIARKYTGKGKGPDRIVYQTEWIGDKPPVFLDLDKPAPTFFRDRMRFMAESQNSVLDDIPVEVFDKFVTSVNNPATTGGEIIRGFRDMMSTGGVLRYQVDELMDDFAFDITEAGYDGLKHIGGRYASKTGEEHTVRIFLEPEKLRVSEVTPEQVIAATEGKPAVTRTVRVNERRRGITELDIKRIEEGARTYALGETRNLLYDLAESSQLARMLKFLTPFYSAWQEVLTRWSGLAIENPAYIARLHQIWQAPEKAGILTDENGREIVWGQVYDKDERGSERYINLPLPDWAKDAIPGARDALDSKGNLRFNRKGLNMVMSGLPGFGPIAQIPVNEILKSRPDLESSLKFIAPFGAQYGILNQVLPSYAKLAISEIDEDRAFTTSVMRIWTDKMVEYELKLKDNPDYAGGPPTWDDTIKEARAFQNLRRVSAVISPIALGFTSPYQVQIDAFRQAQRRYAEDKTKMALADADGNPRTPDEWFLDEYGKEYFALTQSVTRSLNGIPPTLEAWQASKKLKDLIAANPEYGGLILGLDTGEFNNGVYNAQLNAKLSPGSSKNQREVIPLDEAMTDPARRLGWIEYRRFMDGIEAARIAENLPNLQVKGAKDLAEMKAMFTDDLKRRNPAWAEDFNQTDKGKWDKRIEVFTALASNPQLANRTEFQLLKEYLDAREVMNLMLSERGEKKNGSKTLTASSNQDLKELWDIMTGSLIERDLDFSNLYYHYLENDPLGL